MPPPHEVRTPPGWGSGGAQNRIGQIGMIDFSNDGRIQAVYTPDEVELMRIGEHPDDKFLIEVRDRIIRRYLDPECLDVTPPSGRAGWLRLDWNAAAPGAPGSPYYRKGRPRFQLEGER